MSDFKKPLYFLGDSKDNLLEFPKELRKKIGVALDFAQQGLKAHHAKPLKGYDGASVVEIIESFDGDTYRVVYTVKFKEAIYVLHAFQKKSKTGISTPMQDLKLIEERLKLLNRRS